MNPDGSATEYRSHEAGLAHELGHIFEWLNPLTFVLNLIHPNISLHEKTEYRSEVVSCVAENIFRLAVGDPIRVSYARDTDLQSSYSEGTDLYFSPLDIFIMHFLTK